MAVNKEAEAGFCAERQEFREEVKEKYMIQ